MNKRRGFTLIECAIVLVVIGILLGIAVPQFMRSRANSQMKTCAATLKRIDEAKELWAIATHQAAGAPCNMVDIVPDYISRTPNCPSAGVYVIGNIDEDPECSLGSLSSFPHRL